MGDPAFFRILGGANPHTRTRWGVRKTVDRAKALAQWRRLADLFTELGLRIYVVPAAESSPGLVFPANAGFLTRAREEISLDQKTFYLSQTVATRAREKAMYRSFLDGLGFRTADFPNRFEGEADLFEAGNRYIFTSGRIEEQGFVPRWSWPPYRRVYGFRSAPSALERLGPLAHGRPVLPLTLVRETHYHGDTCLCAFGRRREFLMAYLPALAPESQEAVKEHFQERLLPLSEEDGELFSANSFQVDQGSDPVLVMPHAATKKLQAEVRERGARPVTADVSEFMEKGGGSVKCMVGDLGPLAAADEDVAPAARKFRQEHLYKSLFPDKL
jgi:N-dimethylarginine dimethylaminohydrolase